MVSGGSRGKWRGLLLGIDDGFPYRCTGCDRLIAGGFHQTPSLVAKIRCVPLSTVLPPMFYASPILRCQTVWRAISLLQVSLPNPTRPVSPESMGKPMKGIPPLFIPNRVARASLSRPHALGRLPWCSVRLVGHRNA